jgi:hypothetical protein
MSAVCGILRESFDEYLSETLPAPQRRMLREHLAACETCRDAAAAKDASLLFARPTTTEEVRPDETAEILAAVRAGVAHIETERRIAGHPGRRRSAVAAAAAAVALLALTVPGGSSRRQAEIATAPVPTRVASEPAVVGLAPAALPAETEAPPSNATIYDLNPGAGREEPRVVWIVDRGLDI